MAARTQKPKHDENSKRRIQASQLLNRLYLLAMGKGTMRSEQVLAAKIVIGKTIPDLKAVEHTGRDSGPIQHEASLCLSAEEAYLRMVGGHDRGTHDN